MTASFSVAARVLQVSSCVVLIAACTVAVLTVAAPSGLFSVLVLACALAFTAALALLPVRVLPAAALVLFVVLPQQAVAGVMVAGLSPASIAMLAWVLRRWMWDSGSAGREPREYSLAVARLAAAALVAWCVWLITSQSGEALINGVGWTASLTVGLVLPLLVTKVDAELQVLWRVAPVVTIGAALYAVLEFSISRNIVFSPIYDVVGRSVAQEWAIYRAHGSFGHPLYAATFFSTMAALALGRSVSSGRPQTLWILAGLFGALVTVSRSAVVAIAAGAAVAATIGLLRHGRRAAKPAAAGLALMTAASASFLVGGAFQERGQASEAGTSSDAREQVVAFALTAARSTDWLGIGPASADRVVTRLSDNNYIVESSPLQILVSVGVPGLGLFTLVLMCVFINAASRRAVAGMAGAVSLFVAMAGYNAVETLLPLHVLIGLVLALFCREDLRGRHGQVGPRHDAAALRIQAGAAGATT